MTRNSSSRLEGQSDQFRQGWRTNIENGLKVLLSLCFLFAGDYAMAVCSNESAQ